MTTAQGYRFYPSRYGEPLGYPQLDLYLLPNLTERLFDVQVADFPVLRDGETTWLTLYWGEIGAGIYRMAPGRFWLQDDRENLLEGFSFGGRLEVQVDDDQILCRLTSTAPIFELANEIEAPSRVFVDEVEAAIAIERARWRCEDEEWPPFLAHTEPMTLFTTCLATVHARLERNPNGSQAFGWNESQPQSATRAWVHRAIRILKDAGEWPERETTIAELSESTAPAPSAA